MKALTLQRPWGWAILYAGKDVENRTWATSHRGPLLIHQGKGLDPDSQYFPPLRDALRAAFAEGDERMAGAGLILGSVNLVGCHEQRLGCCASAWAAEGQWHWELTDRRPLVKPIAARGKLGIWAYDEASA